MESQGNQPPDILQRVMLADRFRLQQMWRKLHSAKQARGPGIENNELDQWWQRANRSAEKAARRAASVPTLQYDLSLPVSEQKDELKRLIQSHQTIVVCGETGSGKSTQLPKICLEAGLGEFGVIGHTQPRRLAARAVASRIAEELGPTGRELVGTKIRFSDNTGESTLVKLMTDGILLAETQGDRFLNQYSAIIIDEAHERSLNIDFLLGYLKNLQSKRPDLKLIITSATIDPQRFAEHFATEAGPAPIIEVSGRTYPVEVRYRPLESDEPTIDSDEETLSIGVTNAVDELMAEGSGDILTFLPTERDIRSVAKHLRGHFTRLGRENAIEILPLYARLSQQEQNRIFSSHNKRRIVLSTNVAESSLTVPGILYVIDTGLVRISRYAPRSKVQRLPIEAVSQASANQRSGRCGRIAPGVCIRLFSEDDYQKRPKFTTPEIRRSDLASVVLQSLMLKLGPLEEFPLLDPPSTESMRDAARTLRELGVIDRDGRLTAIGQQVGKLPCEPRIGRMLVEGAQRKCLADVLIIAAGLECQDVRQRPAGQRPAADAAHAQFLDPHSDFLSLVRLWDFYEKLKSDLSRSRLEKALESNFLSHHTFREWSEMIRQLRDLLESAGLKPGARTLRLPSIQHQEEPIDARNQGRKRPAGETEPAKRDHVKIERPAGYEAVHQSLQTGLLSGVAEKGDRNEYKGCNNLALSLWPGSGLFRRTPKWIVAAEIVETTKRYARTVAEIDAEWIEQAASEILKHSYYDPHWSSKSGSAMVYRKSTLYGLTVVTGRRTSLGSLDREEARRMLIEHGLVEGEWRCDEAFYRHNTEMLADMHELLQRTRQRDFILDKYHLFNFYNDRIPADVFDLSSLRSWIAKNKASDEVKRLFMSAEDLLDDETAQTPVADQFPNHLSVEAADLPMKYHFEPGHAADGVTVTVPQAALRQISNEMLDWLVPGLLEEKILAVIKGLPKAIRTNFVPAPDVAKKLTKSLSAVAYQRPFFVSLAEAMTEHSKERITASMLSATPLPDHLKMRIEVIDDQGHAVDAGRDLIPLVAAHADTDPATAIQLSSATESTWVNKPIQYQEFERIPSAIHVKKAGMTVAMFPALVDLGDKVELQLADSRMQAERLSVAGFTRLFAIKHHRTLRNQVANLPKFSESSVRLSHIISGKELGLALQDLLIRIALIDGQEAIQDRYELEARNARASVQINLATQELAAWLPKLAERVQELRLLLDKSPAIWKVVTDDIRSQLKSLFEKDFLKSTPWEWLVEYPRYLQAAVMRMEKLKNGGVAKDAKLHEPIGEALTALNKALCSDQMVIEEYANRVQRLRWLMEEMRVAVYAQQLGTKHPASPKRISEFIGTL